MLPLQIYVLRSRLMNYGASAVIIERMSKNEAKDWSGPALLQVMYQIPHEFYHFSFWIQQFIILLKAIPFLAKVFWSYEALNHLKLRTCSGWKIDVPFCWMACWMTGWSLSLKAFKMRLCDSSSQFLPNMTSSMTSFPQGQGRSTACMENAFPRHPRGPILRKPSLPFKLNENY